MCSQAHWSCLYARIAMPFDVVIALVVGCGCFHCRCCCCIASMWPIKCSHEKMFLLSIPFSFVHCRQFSVLLNHTKINMKNYSDFYSWIFYHCFGVAFILSHFFTFLFKRSRRIELQIYTLKQWQCFCDYLLVRNMNWISLVLIVQW